jgi:mono/diheme cytochrome c family protein
MATSLPVRVVSRFAGNSCGRQKQCVTHGILGFSTRLGYDGGRRFGRSRAMFLFAVSRRKARIDDPASLSRHFCLPLILLAFIMCRFLIAAIVVLSFGCASLTFAAQEDRESAQKESGTAKFSAVADVFERHCLSCHNDQERQGGLSLSSAASFGKGGDEGPIVDLNTPAESLLLKMISGSEPEMPQDSSPLSDHDVATIKSWLETGAAWPGDRQLQDRSLADLNWWSLKPLQRPSIPAVHASRDESSRIAWGNPIDAFVQAKLREHGLAPSQEADRKSLIRRVYFDLLGLPPTPDEVRSFVQDVRADAYERMIDGLLADPRYGERWARHWLDVVHYADTHGYDKDKLRPNAWPYRDYVIRALNQDKPYVDFIREQLAADTLNLNEADSVVPLGFISAGPWDFVGHAEVPESKIDGQVARHLDRDDMVSTTMNAFCSVTVQCAQCHNHKFDPVSQQDYYGLQAVFAAVDRTEKPYDPDPSMAGKRAEISRQLAAIQSQLQAFDLEIRKQAGDELTEIENRLSALTKGSDQPLRPEYGYHSEIAATDSVEKWVQVDLGSSQSLKHIVLVACNDAFNNIGAGFGFPVRFKIEVSDDPSFVDAQVVSDQTTSNYPNPKSIPQVFATDCAARYVRARATQLAPRQNDFIFALAEMIVLDDSGTNVAFGRTTTALDSIEAPERWRLTNLVDGIHPARLDDGTIPNLVNWQRERDSILASKVDAKLLAEREKMNLLRSKIEEEQKQLPSQQMAFVGGVHFGSGAFVGTGSKGGQPRVIRVLARGDVRTPGAISSPGALSIFPNEANTFDLPSEHYESARRLALADWISRHDHPLTWRSIANRLWQYHFGRGIVDSPNDFGRMGQLPTHPELLDWLACEIRDDQAGGSLKRMHRLILTSHTYRQTSAVSESGTQGDGDNRYLWRMNRRRLDAESIYDSVLAVSGKLRPEMGGSGYWCFVLEKPEHSPHYQYDQLDVDDIKTHRRAIYRFIVRSAPDPLMECLDCADPSLLVPKRSETITALQALSMFNNKFMLRMSEHFASDLERTGANLETQLQTGFERALGRSPKPNELQALTQFAQEHGLPHACRLILNLNEFIFVD